MTQSTLPMEMPSEKLPAIEPELASTLRINKPVRNQAEMVVRDLDSLIEEDHPVRAMWDFLSRLDLTTFYTSIKVDLNQPGRPASDPQVLLALWIYATVEGISSARRLAILSEEHDVYRWIRGRVPVDYHLLAEFRVTHQEEIDNLITQIIAVLLKEEIVELKRVSQDGTKVPASAGRNSFHRERTLKRCLEEARSQVESLAQEREHSDPLINQRQRSAQERAAREKQARLEEAWRQLPQQQAIKARQKKKLRKDKAAKVVEARVSTTDPDARKMKMPNGGYQAAYNVQYATDTESQVIVGVAVSNQGSDQGQAREMEIQVEQRTGRQPQDYLIDGGFIDLIDIQSMEKKGIKVYAPARSSGTNEGKGLQGVAKSKEVMAWRSRMQTEDAKILYRDRASTSECVNALMRIRYGLKKLSVRGIPKVLNIASLMVLTHNLFRWISLTSAT
jgi:transposase